MTFLLTAIFIPDCGYFGFRKSSREYRRGCARIGRFGQDHPLLRGGGPDRNGRADGRRLSIYTQADLHVLRFIKRARDLGFSIERIRRLLDLWQNKSRASRDVKRLALDHVADIAAKIIAMSTMRDTVQEIADQCEGDDRPECPILRDLEG